MNLLNRMQKTVKAGLRAWRAPSQQQILEEDSAMRRARALRKATDLVSQSSKRYYMTEQDEQDALQVRAKQLANDPQRRAIYSVNSYLNIFGIPRPNFWKADNDRLARNAIYAVCEKRIMDTIETIEWDITDAHKESVPFAVRFMKNPNPQDTFQTLIKQTIPDLLRYDQAAWVKTRALAGNLLEFKAYSGPEFWIEVDNKFDEVMGQYGLSYYGPWSHGYVKRYWQHSRPGVYIPFAVKDVCLLMMYKKADSIYGTDFIQQLKWQLEYMIDSTKAAGMTFANGVGPSLIWKHPDLSSIEQLEERNMEVELENKGAENFGNILHLIGQEDISTVFPELMHMQWLEGQKFISSIIWAMFGFSESEFTSGDANRACYSEDTEVLTENGWKLHQDVTETERISIYDIDLCECRLETPLKLSSYEVDEDLVRFKSNAQDFFVTKEHTILRRGSPCYKKSGWKVTKAQEEIGKSLAVKGAIESWVGEPQPVSDDYLSFLGWAISEGGLSTTGKKKGHYTMTLAQSNKKPDHVKEIKRVLKSLGLKHEGYQNIKDNTTRWNINSKKIIGPLFTDIGAYCTEKKIPRKYINLPREKLQKLFEALMAGDGSWDKREKRTCGYYSTTSSQLADDFQEIAFKLGYATKRNIHYLGKGNRVTCHRILLLKKITRQVTNPKLEHYSGKVYCFTTSTGFYITRRNGCIAIQGNTAYINQNITKSKMLAPILRHLETVINDEILPELDGYQEGWIFAFKPVQELDDKLKEAQYLQAQATVVKSYVDMNVPIEEAMRLAGVEEEHIMAVIEALDTVNQQQSSSMEAAFQNLLSANNLPPRPDIGNGPPGNQPPSTPVDASQAPTLPPDQGGMPHVEGYSGQARNDSGKPEDDGQPKGQKKLPFFEKAESPKLTMTGTDPRPDTDYDPAELAMGIKVEMEHTDDPAVAKKIAKDQLDEDGKYYTHLKSIEKADFKESEHASNMRNENR